MTTLLKLSQIVTTAGTQIRAAIDEPTVADYADAMQDATKKFPPIVVFHDGSDYILADGFHRVLAASRNGFIDIEATVIKGTRLDALRFALSANARHGKPRTSEDKYNSVRMAFKEWHQSADREIARLCEVCPTFVAKVRKQLSTVDSCGEPRIGADGKTRKLPKKSLGGGGVAPDSSETKPTGGEPTEPNPDRPEPTPSACPHLPNLTQVKNDIAAAISDIEAFETGTEDFTLDNCSDVANALRDAAKALLKAQREAEAYQ